MLPSLFAKEMLTIFVIRTMSNGSTHFHWLSMSHPSTKTYQWASKKYNKSVQS